MRAKIISLFVVTGLVFGPPIANLANESVSGASSETQWFKYCDTSSIGTTDGQTGACRGLSDGSACTWISNDSSLGNCGSSVYKACNYWYMPGQHDEGNGCTGVGTQHNGWCGYQGFNGFLQCVAVDYIPFQHRNALQGKLLHACLFEAWIIIIVEVIVP